MPRPLVWVVAVGLLAASCGGPGEGGAADPPQPITAEQMDALLAASTAPVVVNVWASWCVPCRSEAPLLDSAARLHAGEIRFVMLDVRDRPPSASAFIDEFYGSAPMEHYGDQPGDIPLHLGGSRGVPMTFFYEPGGDQAHVHFGVIDERTLALQLDELARR